MRKNPVKSNIKAYLEALQSIQNLWKQGKHSTLVLFWGSDEFLLFEAFRQLKQTWKNLHQTGAQILEGKDIANHQQFASLWEERNIFEPSPCYMIPHILKIKDFSKLLGLIPSSTSLQSPICIGLKTNRLSTGIEKECIRLKARIVPCMQARIDELPYLLNFMSKCLNLSFDTSAINLLIETVGDNLFKLQNELNKLSLILYDSEKAVISARDISPYLGLLREEHVFEISQYLLTFQNQKAHFLIQDLLQRGESALALLGILSRHLRTAIKIRCAAKENHSIHDISRTLRLPFKVVGRYCEYIKKVKYDNLLLALEKCHHADVKLKFTNKFPEDLLLAEILMCI